MNTDLINPLAGIIAQAAKLPSETGATNRYRQRTAQAGDANVILADCSSSMEDTAWAGKRKIDLLREALSANLAPGERFIAFGEEVAWTVDMNNPRGSTPLHKAILLARASSPRHTIVISDGRPDDEEAALFQAERLTGTIDVIYVGPEDDKEAIAFMRRLAQVGLGRVIINDLRRSTGQPPLGSQVKGLLTRG